jgi:N-methylhydantoinase A
MVIFPPQASVLSAFGTLVTPVRLDLVRSALGGLNEIDWDDVDRLLNEMAGESLAALVDAGCAPEAVRLTIGADLRFFGQQNEVGVSFARDPREGRDIEMIREVFEAIYLARYGVVPSHVPVEIVSWRLTAQGPEIEVEPPPSPPRHPGAAKAERNIPLWSEAGPAKVYDRAALAVGQQIAGPAIIEERETTIVLPPDWDAVVNKIGCVTATRKA